MKLTVKTAFVCDDVRREDNGKLIIIGAYGRNIGLLKLPSTIRLSLVVRAEADEPGAVDVEFAAFTDGEMKASQRGHLLIDAAGATMFNVPHLLIEVEKPATLEFRWHVRPSEDWETIFSIPVGLSEGVVVSSDSSPPA